MSENGFVETAETLEQAVRLGAFVVLYLGVYVPLFIAALYALYFLLTLPMRRNERARLFLDLIELGLKSGRTAEATVLDAAASRDPRLGVRFYLLAAHLQSGLRMSEALERVPALLPPPVRAMWRAGERLDDVTRVLPACRRCLRDAVSQTRGALNYLVVLVFCVTPLTLILAAAITINVVSKLREVFGQYIQAGFPEFCRLVLNFWGSGLGLGVQGALLGALWLAAALYVGGPYWSRWLGRFGRSLADLCALSLPWRRKRLERDFSAMLSVLLDSGVAEPDAVPLAAQATGNARFGRRAAQVCERLAAGVALPEALQTLDDSGELRWRIANARRGKSGFATALAGWQEALDAKAFQLEQTAAHVATTAVVLFNGAIVGTLVVGTFLLFVTLLEEAVLW